MNKPFKKIFFYFLGRFFYAVGLFNKATIYYSHATKIRFFFLDIQERYKKSILKSKRGNFYIIKGGIGDILQHLPFMLENKNLKFFILTYFSDAQAFLHNLGVYNCKFIYYFNKYEYRKYTRLLNLKKNVYSCPRDIFFSKLPFEGIEERFVDVKRRTIGLHFNSSQMGLIKTIPKALQEKLIKMLIINDFNVIVFSSHKEYLAMDKIKSICVKYSHAINLEKNLAKVIHCDFFIGSDSAFKTMSTMLKIPTLVIIPNDEVSSFGHRMFFQPYLITKILTICRLKKNTTEEINKTLSFVQKKLTIHFKRIEYREQSSTYL
jgi:hypothetical protein